MDQLPVSAEFQVTTNASPAPSVAPQKDQSLAFTFTIHLIHLVAEDRSQLHLSSSTRQFVSQHRVGDLFGYSPKPAENHVVRTVRSRSGDRTRTNKAFFPANYSSQVEIYCRQCGTLSRLSDNIPASWNSIPQHIEKLKYKISSSSFSASRLLVSATAQTLTRVR